MEKRTSCKGCFYRCSMYIEFSDDNKPIKVKPDKEDPISGGILCARNKPIVFEKTYHPERLLYPLKRKGSRGGGEWEQITWDKALDEIAMKLKKIRKGFGAEAIAMHGANGFGVGHVARRFMNLLGSPNYTEDGVVCFIDLKRIEDVTYGWPAIWADHANAKCNVAWAGNFALVYEKAFSRMKQAKAKGAKLIVIDPRFTETARIADLWLQLRPATDGALMLCWINTIIRENLYDREFVEKWTNAPYLVRSDTNKLLREEDIKSGGEVEKFVAWDVVEKRAVPFNRKTLSYESKGVKPALAGAYVVQLMNGRNVECKTVWQLLIERVAPYTAERVSEITWVPPEKILDSARMYATNKPGNIRWGNGLDCIGINAGQAMRAKCILRAITGSIDVQGGDIIPGPYTKKIFDSVIEENDKLPQEQKAKALGADKFRLTSWKSYEEMWEFQRQAGFPAPIASASTLLIHKPLLWRAILTGKPYPVRSLLVAGANPAVASPNIELVHEALKNLDLLVVNEFFMTPTAELADYVLPAAPTGLESPELHSMWETTNNVIGADGALESPGECWSDWKFYRELGVRMGQNWPWKTIEEMYDYQLEPMGYKWREFADKVHRVMPPPTFKKYEKSGFGTPSGKVEIYSSYLEKLEYDPLPDYEEPPESYVSTPELSKKYPYILIGHRLPLFRNAAYQQLPSIRKTHPESLVQIHPDTAASLGITEGDWVWIESTMGKKIKQKARLFDGIHPKVVSADILRWYPQGPWESNVNFILDDDPDVFSDSMYGCWTLRGTLCKIYKV
jgi:anaerobic selenocysteine-containing dehydrogenase